MAMSIIIIKADADAMIAVVGDELDVGIDRLTHGELLCLARGADHLILYATGFETR